MVYSLTETKESYFGPDTLEGSTNSLQVEGLQKNPLQERVLKVVGAALLTLGCVCLALTAKEILFLAVYKVSIETALIETLATSTIFCFWIGKSLMENRFPDITVGANLGILTIRME